MMGFNPVTYIINMEQRADRLDHVIRQMQIAAIENYRMFKAFDNSVLGLRDGGSGTLRFGAGFIGVYLSHLAIFKMAICYGFDEIMVLEDDIIMKPDFKQKWMKCKTHLPDGWDMVYLHHGGSNKEHLASHKGQVSDSLYKAGYVGSFAAYILTKSGLHKIHRILNSLIQDHIDISLAEYNTHHNDFAAYYICPSLVEINTELSSDNKLN